MKTRTLFYETALWLCILAGGSSLTAAAATTQSPTVPAATTTTATVQTAAATKKAVSADTPKTVDPLAGRDTNLIKKFYLTSGKTYDQTTHLIYNLNPSLTGLSATQTDYYLRIDKELTDKYFRRVRAYRTDTKELAGEYLVAKDQSSVWRTDGNQPGMIYGSAEKLLKKSRLVVYPRYLALGSKGVVRMQIPGNVPYTLTARSLNDSIARVTADNTIEPIATGKADIMTDYAVGDQKGTVVQEIRVVTKEDLERMAYQAYIAQLYIDTMWDYDPWPYGWGWYGPHYHHHAPPPPPRGHRPPPPPPRR